MKLFYLLFAISLIFIAFQSFKSFSYSSIETQKYTIECSTDDEVKLVMFSDGVGDVLAMETDIEKLKIYSAEEIVDLAEKRWKQVWNYNGKKIKFPSNGYDDCCCAIWYNKKM